ncbi:MAG: cysteine hydrolase [Desulfobacteraceae bacterium]|nr:MAG: cysteine hydrolase [Desulfobacteraceae bacterium]
MVDFKVVPVRTALLNIDMQNCFVEDSPISAVEGLTILGRINRLSAECRKAGIPVIHTSLVLRPDGSNLGVLAETSPPAKAGMLNKGSASTALHEGLMVDPRDILLDKPRFGAFHGTDLELILRSRGIDTVIISGIATNVCCETTAREAMVRDFHVFFLSDGTATAPMGNASAAELQKATLATVGFLFGQVLTVDEMIEKIRSASRTCATPARG